MPDQINMTQRSLLVAGVMVSCIGIAHIFMPTYGYEARVPLSMSADISDHFFYLGTYAIYSFLLTLGFISIYIARLNNPKVSFVICSLFSLLWIGRAILEVIYPVRVKLFILSHPTIVLFPFISLIAIIYCIGSIAHIRSGKER